MALSFTAVFDHFKDEITVLKRGEQHLNSNDVTFFMQSDNLFTLKVKASMKKLEYTVKVSMNKHMAN
jgi:hypothetical protein